MKLVVGLGNPGKEYENTRHNVGFMVIDKFCDGDTFTDKMGGLFLKKKILGEDVIFLKPQKYMNLSGEVVVKYLNYFKISPKDILVIRDDLDLPLGTSKLKFNSSSGGDNGVKSIIQHLNTQEFGQYKIGIKTDIKTDAVGFVLGKFSNGEMQILDKCIQKSGNVIESFIKSGIFETMNKFNGEMK